MCTIWPCRKGGTPETTKKKPKSINVSSQRYGSEKKFKSTLKFKVARIFEPFRILPPLLPPSKQGTSVQKDPLGGVIGRLALCASTTCHFGKQNQKTFAHLRNRVCFVPIFPQSGILVKFFHKTRDSAACLADLHPSSSSEIGRKKLHENPPHISQAQSAL